MQYLINFDIYTRKTALKFQSSRSPQLHAATLIPILEIFEFIKNN